MDAPEVEAPAATAVAAIEPGLAPRGSPLSSLSHPHWRLLWYAGHLWHVAYWLDVIVLAWLMLELTDSPLLVSLTGTARLAPLGILGFPAGAWADRVDKRRLLIAAQLLNLGATAAFAVVLLLNLEQPWQLYAVALLTGTGWAIDFPVRRAFVRDLLPDEAVPNAMTIDAASLVGSGMVGRWLAGGLLVLGGATAAYVFLTLTYVGGLGLLLRVPPVPVEAPPSSEARTRILADLRSGLAYVWENRALRGVLLITLAVNLLAFPYIVLVPVLARDVYGAGPFILGLISGMDGLGALAGTTLVAVIGVRRGGFGRLFVAGAVTVAGGAMLLGFVPAWPLAIPVLMLIGLGMAGFATMQTTIAATVAEPRMRGRAMGALALAVSTLPIGMFYVGFVASRIGTPEALAIHAALGVALLAAIAAAQPALRRA